MSYYEVGPAQTGIGYAPAIAAILGPVVEGGAAAYGVYTSGKQGKAELRQRRREYQGQQELQRKAPESQREQFALAQQAAIQQEQIKAAYGGRNWPYIMAAIGIAALALISIAAVTKRKRKRKAKKKR